MALRFVWQAWHLATWTCTLCGRRGTYGTQLGLVTRLVAAGAASFCVAGVALGDMDLRFVWQAWRLATWTFTLCGRRGAYGIQLGLVTRLVAAGAASFCVAGMALGDMDLRSAWQAWHLATWTFTLCGRCGTYGIQLGLVTRLVAAAPHHSAWQAWHLVTWTFVLCGRRGTWRHGLSLCVAGVALTALDPAWHLVTWTFVLCGRRGTWRHGLSLCGRRGTYETGLGLVTRLVAAGAASFCVAGVALGDMDLRFVWQAWRLVTWTFVLRGRRGTWRHGPSLCVAGMALTALSWVW
eukprot:s3172_g10.t1